MEIGIFSSHMIWRVRHRKIRQEAKWTGKSIEEVLEEQEEYQDSSTQDGDAEALDLEGQPPAVNPKDEDYR